MSMTGKTSTFDALVDLVRTIRPEWQVPGLRKAIGHALDKPNPPSLADVTYALVRLASDPTIRTPWVLTYDGPHWRKQTDGARQIEGRICPECHRLHTPTAPCETGTPVTPERMAEHLATARALVAERTARFCRHGPGCRECRDTNKQGGTDD